jgi:hypothetical protein
MKCSCLWIKDFFALSGELPSVSDQARQVHDLVFWGGYSYEAVMSMPPFLRLFFLERTHESNKIKYKFEADVHGAKLEG